jgi:hypothetical protein
MEILVQMIVVILALAVRIYQSPVLLLTRVQQVFVLLDNVYQLLFYVTIKSIVLLILVILVQAVSISLIIPIVPPQILA